MSRQRRSLRAVRVDAAARARYRVATIHAHEESNMQLSGCSAVVTGGASGLGEATARALAASGVKVALFDLNAEKGMAVAASIRGLFCHVNVTQEDSVDAGFA